MRDVVSALRGHAAGPDRVALSWLPELAGVGRELTFGQLDREASAVAAALREQCRPGDRVLLVQEPGLDFVVGFFGCLYAGMVAVPVYPDLFSAHVLATVRSIAADCGAAVVWSSDGTVAKLAAEALGVTAVRETGAAPFVPDAPPDPGQPAFLQYTSGSTGAPKGVIVTHGNLAANVTAIAGTFGHDQRTRVLSWLPAYHDMGLIGNILHPLHLGCQAFLAPPYAFIRRPTAWIEAVARHQISTSGAPNFAYAMVVTEVARRGLPDPPPDLSGWQVAYCGAEPVRAQTLRQFADCLAPLGFSAESFMPCYGLAEATLLVSSAPSGRAVVTRSSRLGAATVACGRARGCDIAVTGADGRRLADGQEGEILVSGPGVAAGYWNRPAASREAFGNTVAGDDRNWLRTGDLGFLADGELHVTGRRKDLLIVRGRNYHPADIEQFAQERSGALRPGCLAVFQAPNPAGGEDVVLVAEPRPGRELTPAERRRLAAAVSGEFGVALAEIVILGKGRVPKTTSGKIRRAQTRSRFLAGQYDAYRQPLDDDLADDRTMAPADLAGAVRQAVRETLGRDVPWAEPLAAYGLDSLGGIRLAEALLRYTGADIEVLRLLGDVSPADLLGHAERAAAAAQAGGTRAGGAAAGAELAQAQQSLAFLQSLDPLDDSYVICRAWELAPGTDTAAFDEALRMAIGNDPELAMRVVVTPAGMRRERVAARLLESALALRPTPITAAELPDRLAEIAAEPFGISDGPLFRLRVWQAGDRRIYQFAAHHIVTDLWSLCLLLRDVGTAYAALAAGLRPSLTPPASYDDFVADQRNYLDSPAATERDALLARRLPGRPEPLRVLTDQPRGRRRAARAGRVSAALPQRVVRALGEGDPIASLIALWALCVYRYGTPSPVVVGVPVAGRPTGRHAEVRGLCTNTVPLAFDIDPAEPLRSLAGSARAQLSEGIAAGLYPLARAVNLVRPARIPGRSPLVETLVTVEQNPLPEIGGLVAAFSGCGADVDLNGLRLSPVPAPVRNCRYDLDVIITPLAGDWRVTLEYAAELFTERTAQAILATYVAMAEAATEPGRPRPAVGDVFALSAGDRALLDSCCGPAGRGPGGATAGPAAAGPPTELIRLVAAIAPDAPALADAEGVVTFGQLCPNMDTIGQALSSALAAEGGAR